MQVGAGVKVGGGPVDLKAGPDLAATIVSAEQLQFLAEVLGQPAPAVPAPEGAVLIEAEELARLVLAEFGRQPVAAIRRRLSALRVQAASRVRAARMAGPGLRHGGGVVTVHNREQPFAGFFAVEETLLSHSRFDGATSPVLRREVFLSGDAVTVLPYDPGRDRVLVIEQLRMGPLGRGDPFPWQVEAIAGRIDPGESPEDCARREAVEEAGLQLGHLEKVGEYYPSPGAVSEYIYSFVAICDLPDDVAGIFGAASEAEDIRGFLLTHADLMAALARGEVTNAPLALTAYWLDRERARLRADAR